MKYLKRKINRKIDDIINFCDRHDKIYLYGAGVVSERISALLNEWEIDIAGILVTKINAEGNNIAIEFGAVPISERDGIVLAVDYDKQAEIATYLIRNGIKYRQVFFQNLFLSYKSVEAGQRGDADNGCFFSDYNELDEIGKEYKTDKCSEFHNYLRKYEFFIKKYKDQYFNLLELGVYHGSSIKMWEEYFQNAKIFGVDINEETKKYETDIISILIKDLGNADNLKIIKQLKPLIIIDDASHWWSHQIMSLYVLFDAIPNGGIYIVEDIETSFGEVWEISECGDASITMYDFLQAICEAYTGDFRIHSRNKNIAELEDEILCLASMVDMITFIHGSCIIVKK